MGCFWGRCDDEGGEALARDDQSACHVLVGAESRDLVVSRSFTNGWSWWTGTGSGGSGSGRDGLGRLFKLGMKVVVWVFVLSS